MFHSYECHCTDRYSGKNCEIDSGPPCSDDSCTNGGTCVEDLRGNIQCHCPPTFTGKFCETEISVHPLCQTQGEICLHNGTCKVSPAGKIECDCIEGFVGSRCEIDAENDCVSSPCQNGICIDEIGGFRCDCNGTGFSGTLCQNDRDECLIGNPCLNSGECFNTYGSYICVCPKMFGGSNCELQLLDGCSSQPCGYGATCVYRSSGNIECICPPGASGQFCENKSSESCLGECPEDTECINGHCVCRPGGNCDMAILSSLDDCNCLNGGTCGINSSICVCPKGFEGKRCERLSCNANNCQEPMACVSGKCICPEHATCSGACLSNPCKNNAICHNTAPNEYYCQCQNGFNGTNCELDVDECAAKSDICGHGICVNQIGSFKCYCEPGFTGLLCDLDGNFSYCYSS